MGNNVIILAGGQGKRMKINSPKALCNVLGEPMLEWVMSACEDAGLADICICAPEDETFKIQELHLPIYHALCTMIECELFEERK